MTHGRVGRILGLTVLTMTAACGGSSSNDSGRDETGGNGGSAAATATGGRSGSSGSTGGSGGGHAGSGGDLTGGSGGASGAPAGSGGGSGEGGTATGGGGTGGVSGEGGTATGGGGTAGLSGEGGSATGGGGTSGGSGEGGSAAGDGGTGGISGNGGSAAGGAGSGGVSGSECPASPPVDGSPCSPPWEPSGGTYPELVIAHCSWGDDPRSNCRTMARCEDGAWVVTAPNASLCGDLLPPECGSTPPEEQSACSDTTLACWYDDGTSCGCSECLGGSPYPSCQYVDPPQWHCGTARDECYPFPQAGSACTDEGVDCGSCSSPMRCQDGRWQWLSCATCCPICAAPNTPIATPEGEKPIASLAVGDLVYSVDAGAIRAVPLVQVSHTPVARHHVMRIVLEGGRVLEISPGHPTADNRQFGNLAPGSPLDEQHRVVTAALVPYAYDATYDILPASSTGTYFAAGALVGSTLFER